MSPQPRRGRAAPAGHRKAPSHAASPTRKPTEAIEPVDADATSDDQFDETAEPSPGRRQVRHVRRARRQSAITRFRRSSAAHYAYEAVKEYRPLLLAFVIIFGGVWAWISFGPHTPTPKDNWTRIENTWLQKREADRQKVSDAINDFGAQLTAYKAFRDDTSGWMKDLAAVTNWDNPQASADVNQTTNSDVAQFIQAGDDEATLLDQVVAAKSPDDVLALGSDQLARTDIFGVAPASPEPTLALPSGSLPPSASPGASGSPGASAGPSESPAVTGSPAPPATSAAPSPSPS